eukprot:scaffold102827_cov60-Phaeocystis_antarctica.AAC.2
MLVDPHVERSAAREVNVKLHGCAAHQGGRPARALLPLRVVVLAGVARREQEAQCDRGRPARPMCGACVVERVAGAARAVGTYLSRHRTASGARRDRAPRLASTDVGAVGVTGGVSLE